MPAKSSATGHHRTVTPSSIQLQSPAGSPSSPVLLRRSSSIASAFDNNRCSSVQEVSNMAVATYLHRKQAQKYADEERAGGATGVDDGEIQNFVMLQSEPSSQTWWIELTTRLRQFFFASFARLSQSGWNGDLASQVQRRNAMIVQQLTRFRRQTSTSSFPSL